MIHRKPHLPRLCCIALVLVGPGPTHAGWVALEKDYLVPGLQTVYVDPETMITEGNLTTVWQLTDYKLMQGSVGFSRFMMSPHRFFSTKTHKQIDCEKKRVRLLAFTEFSGHMETGTATHGYVDKDAWLLIEPESINHALWEVACGQ